MQSPWAEEIAQGTKPLRFVLMASRPYALYALGSILAVVAVASINALDPLIYKFAVNAIANLDTGGSYAEVRTWILVYLGATLAGLVLWRMVVYLNALWSTGVRASGRYVLTAYLLRHSQDYFENRFAGSTASKIGNAGDGARHLIESIMFNFLPFTIGMSVSLVLAFHASLYVGLVFISWLAIAIPLNIWFAKTRAPISRAAQAAETKLRGATVDLVSNIRAAIEYARSALELANLKQLIIERRWAGFKNTMSQQRVTIVNGVLQIAAMGSMLMIILRLGEAGQVTPGDIILVLALATSVGERIFHLGNQIAYLGEVWGEIQEGLADILNEHDIPDSVGARPLSVQGGEVAFDRVLFSYHEGEAVISDLSFTIKGGQKVGLVGRSGAGKSTIVKLLLRHYDLTGGAIMIDGQNIASVTQDSLRRAIGIVPQESLLFHRTIRENIAYGKLGASEEEIIEAATLAQAHDFIMALPNGYETLVGERGVKLSGGQRQRVAIARAILKSAPILLLDEATSALDSESEGEIQKALQSLMKGKTVIAIAHRLSTLKEMDRIIVLDQGNIIEDGSHTKLVRKGGVYAELWKHQSGGYLKDE